MPALHGRSAQSRLLLSRRASRLTLWSLPHARCPASLHLSFGPLQDAEAHLQHHFDNIQDIADSTTLPSLLPALSRALAQAADVDDGPLERLRWAAARFPCQQGRLCAAVATSCLF